MCEIYKITISERVEKTVKIRAMDADEAIAIAAEDYRHGLIEMDKDDVKEVKINHYTK